MSAHSQHAFSEKVALITDAVNPIGRAIAMQLALYGAYVIVGFPPTSGAEQHALHELKSLGTLANAVEADISTVEGGKILISHVEQQYGRLDLLINCQDFRFDSAFDNTTAEVFDETIARNFKSIYFITQNALRLMESRPRPKIVNVISNCDSDASKSDIAYFSANAAAAGFMTALSGILESKFRLNTVRFSEKEKAPGKFDDLDAELFRKRKTVEPDDVARTVLYLLSPEAIGVNGQVLVVE